jgi:hypothetical protein
VAEAAVAVAVVMTTAAEVTNVTVATDRPMQQATRAKKTQSSTTKWTAARPTFARPYTQRNSRTLSHTATAGPPPTSSIRPQRRRGDKLQTVSAAPLQRRYCHYDQHNVM